jgi:hypothetical protein
MVGGTAPMAATYLVARTHNEFAPPLWRPLARILRARRRTVILARDS